MGTIKKNRERISALSDDALPNKDYELARAALRSADGMATWDLYQLIGHVLRAGQSVALPPDFTVRLSSRLACEALPLPRTMVELGSAGGPR